MSSKRSLTTPSTPRKRSKGKATSSNQSNLDTFFRRSDGGANASPGRTDVPVSPSGPTPSSLNVSLYVMENAVIESDEAFALSLARADGLDIDALRNLENAYDPALGRTDTRREVDVIDVDILDVTQTPGSSNSSSPSKEDQHNSVSPNHRVTSTLRSFGQVTVEATLEYSALSVDPLDYSLNSSPWPGNVAAPYSFLAHTLSTLSGTRSRIAILNTLTNALRTIIHFHPASLAPALYLLSNTLAPPYVPIELGLGPAIISKAIQNVSGLSPAALKRLYNATGDPGKYVMCF